MVLLRSPEVRLAGAGSTRICSAVTSIKMAKSVIDIAEA